MAPHLVKRNVGGEQVFGEQPGQPDSAAAAAGNTVVRPTEAAPPKEKSDAQKALAKVNEFAGDIGKKIGRKFARNKKICKQMPKNGCIRVL